MGLFYKNEFFEQKNDKRKHLKEINFDQDADHYEIQIKKRRLWFLLFLPLLLLLLLIRINPSMEFQVVEKCIDSVFDNSKVNVIYIDKDGKTVNETQKSNNNGVTQFKVKGYRLYEYLFKKDELNTTVKLKVDENDTTYIQQEDSLNQLINKRTILGVSLSKAPVKIKVVSAKDNSYVLPGSKVNIKYSLGDQWFDAEGVSDSTGHVNVLISKCYDLISFYGEKNGYYPDSVENKKLAEAVEKPESLILKLKPYNYILDIVFCIDATGSMDNLLSDVKQNAEKFNESLAEEMQKMDKYVKEMRVRVIAYKDFYDSRSKPHIFTTKFFNLPDEKDAYKAELNKVRATAGGDMPESGLEAIALGFQSDWIKTDQHFRRVFVLWTDAEAHKLEKKQGRKAYDYPKDMPKNLDELHQQWKDLIDNSRFVLYAPRVYPWNKMSTWENFFFLRKTGSFKSEEYDETLKAIAESI